MSQKNRHPEIFWHFSKTVGNSWSKVYKPIVRSNLRWTTNFYSYICNCDKVMLY